MIYVITTVASYILLIATTAIEPRRSKLSRFEINRRRNSGDTGVEIEAWREQYFNDITVWFRLLAGLMLVIFVLSSVAAWQWFIGVVVAVLGVLQYIAIARSPFVRKNFQQLYNKVELKILNFANSHAGKLSFLRGVTIDLPSPVYPSSKDELIYIIKNSTGLLTNDEKKFLSSGIKFSDELVGNIMTPKSMVNAVNIDDLAGPILLDNLHKTGNSRFPVIDGDIDHVVGVLYLRDMAFVDIKQIKTVADLMRTPVYYIKNTQNLGHALAAFLKVHSHMFVVVNEYRETVGVITLEDVIEVMIGRKIVDEFDAHEDLRKVARRNPRGNNQAKTGKDVA